METHRIVEILCTTIDPQRKAKICYSVAMKSGRHHAVVFEGEGKEGLEYVNTYLQDTFGIQLQGNPDYAVLERERFTIADARTLKEQSSQAPLGEMRVFVIVTESILHEAQNALLKLLEEPAPHTHFYFILPTTRELLPTVQSRLFFGGVIAPKTTQHELAETFISSTVGERIELLEPIIKKKDRYEARRLLHSVETLLRKEGVIKRKRELSEITHAQQYLTDRSSSIKMLLEHVAVVL